MNRQRHTRAAASSAGSVIGGIVVGVMIAVCFLYTNDEIFENAAAFWKVVFGN